MGESYLVLQKRRNSLIKKMAKIGPFMMATPTYLKVKCGNKKCKCVNDREARHEKLHLSWTDAEGSGTKYVPVSLREEVLEWIENYWIVKEYMKEVTIISRKIIGLYVKSRKKQEKRNKENKVKKT